MRIGKFLLCGLLMALPVLAEEAEDRQTATSLHYVSHELDTRQNKLSAGTNAAITYTNTAGNIEQRTVKENLTGGTTDTSLPMVNAVNAGLNTKQDDISAINDHTAVTYTGQTGTIGQKGIYQTDGTYTAQSDNLIDAKTFNAALKNGLDSEFICTEYKPGTDLCWLWQIHSTGDDALPAGYTALEYISFDGVSNTGSYIDTGLVYYTDILNTNIRFEADAKVYQGAGWQVIVGNIGFRSAYIGTNSANLFYYGAGFSDASTDVSNPYTRCVHNFDAPTGKYAVYNTATASQIVSITGIQAVPKTDNLKVLIGGFEGTPGSIRPERTKMDLYSIKIYDNQTLKFNGIPAKRGNVVGLYDTVSKTFKTSATSTPLTAGTVATNTVPYTTLVPAGYTPVEYIESTGTQFIDTGITANQTMEVTMDYQQSVDSIKWLFGVRDFSNGTGINKFSIQGISSVSNTYWQQFDNTAQLEYGYSAGTTTQQERLARHVVRMNGAELFVDGGDLGSVISSTEWSNFESTHTLLIGCNYASNSGYTSAYSGKIYSVVVNKNGDTVRNFIPAIRNSDSKVGMYDMVSGTFFTNAATSGSDFTAGNPINNIVYIPQNQQ